MKKTLYTILFLFTLTVLIFQTSSVLAIYTLDDATNFTKEANVGVGAKDTTPENIAMGVVRGGLALVGLAFFILIVYAGYMWLIARGKEEYIEKSKSTIIAAVIGLIIVIGSYAISNVVLGRLFTSQVSTGASGIVTPNTYVPTGPLGCCLNQMQVPGGYWDVGNKYEFGQEDGAGIRKQVNWWSSVTDEAGCKIIGLTCDDVDALCGENYYEFIPGTKDNTACMAIAKTYQDNRTTLDGVEE